MFFDGFRNTEADRSISAFNLPYVERLSFILLRALEKTPGSTPPRAIKLAFWILSNLVGIRMRVWLVLELYSTNKVLLVEGSNPVFFLGLLEV